MRQSLLTFFLLMGTSVWAFSNPHLLNSSSGSTVNKRATKMTRLWSSSSSVAMTMEQLQDPYFRQAHYGNNMAQYLLDLHENKATFDFCGGMMFQLVLSDSLKSHLESVASSSTSSDDNKDQLLVYDAAKMRMYQIPRYEKNNFADNQVLFHGREIRNVPNAAGGMGMVLQLSSVEEGDPEGWTKAERAGYDGWGHDVGRTWRNAERLEQEGFVGFAKQFGPKSYALHHRFYLHYDAFDRLWLSAEDGCEGTPSAGRGRGNPITNFFQNLLL